MTKQQAAVAVQVQQVARRRRVCLFGLSGDPPTGTGGHVGIVRRLAQLTTNHNNTNNIDHKRANSNNSDSDDVPAFDEIRILPVYRHTFVNKRNRLASYEDRMKMCQLAFEGIPNTTVSNAEYLSWCHAVKDLPDEATKCKALVGTANLLDFLMHTELASSTTTTSTEFTFCLGADAFMDLMAGKWKQSARVRQLLDDRFLVLDRATYQPEGDSSCDEAITMECNGESNAEFLQQMAHVANARLLVMTDNNDESNRSAVSSSQLRATAAAGSIGDVNDERLLLPAVKEYILQHGLYDCKQDP